MPGVRVVGGWSADQFAERRLPTIAEINAISEDVPIYVLHLYDRAWLNKAAPQDWRSPGQTRSRCTRYSICRQS